MTTLTAHRGDLSILDLTGTRLMPKVCDRLGHMHDPPHMGLRKEPTVGIDR